MHNLNANFHRFLPQNQVKVMDYIAANSTILQNVNAVVIFAPLLVILSVIFLWKSKLNRVKIMEKFPSPSKRNFLFGNALDFNRDPSGK